MGFRGLDGQVYPTLSQQIGADNRYRQQEEQNKLLKEQNNLAAKSLEMQEKKEKEEKEEKKRQEEKVKLDEFYDDLYKFKELFNFDGLKCFHDSKEINQLVINILNYVESILKSEIDCIIPLLENIEKTEANKSNNKNEFETWFDNQSINNTNTILQPSKQRYLIELNIFRNYINGLKNRNIDFNINLFDETFNNVVNYHKKEFKKVKQQVGLQIDTYTYSPGNAKIFDSIQEIPSSLFESLENELRRIKEEKNTALNKVKTIQVSVDNEIQKTNEKIKSLNRATTLTDINEIKEIIANVDYEFLKEILGNTYQSEEIVFLIKGHIKNIEADLNKLVNKKDYYKIIYYLTENETYTKISDYEFFDENIDYTADFEKILKYETEKKEADKKLAEEKKKREEKEKELLEEKRKQEEKEKMAQKEAEHREKEQKELEEKNNAILKLFDEKKSYISAYKGIHITFACLTLISFALIPMVPVSIIVWILIASALKPNKRYLKDIKKLGFDNMEEFEKVALNLKEKSK